MIAFVAAFTLGAFAAAWYYADRIDRVAALAEKLRVALAADTARWEAWRRETTEKLAVLDRHIRRET